MSLGSKVLVATDLSDAADEAIRQGHERARAAGGELIVCHVVPNLLRNNPLFPQSTTGDVAGVVEVEQRALKAVELRVVALTGRALAEFRVVIDNGSPAAGIVHAADENRATLVVVSSSGATGLDRLLLGSVASRVVRYAHCAVLVARPHEKTGKILVATDFSDPGATAVTAAVAEARRSGARPTLLHSLELLPSPSVGWGAPFGATWVVPPPELITQVRESARETLEAMLQRLGAEGDIVVPEGEPITAILDAARDLPAELIVLATRGRTGISRILLGSVAEKVISAATCSVLAVRHG